MAGWKAAVLVLLVILPGGSLELLAWALYRSRRRPPAALRRPLLLPAAGPESSPA